jgi:LPXTG-motif cell wall-anchored protein
MLARKLAATTSIGLGVVMLSFSAPTIASAAADAVSVPAPAGVSAAADTDGPRATPDLPIDPPTSQEPEEPEPTFETFPTPTATTPTPDPSPTTPDLPVPEPTRPAPTVRPTFAPIDPVGGRPGNQPGRGQVAEDEGTTDPGADESDEQGEKSNAEDPALGAPEDPQGAVSPDSAVAPQDAAAAAPEKGALPNTGADANLTWMALLGACLTVFGGVLLKRPRLPRHRA